MNSLTKKELEKKCKCGHRICEHNSKMCYGKPFGRDYSCRCKKIEDLIKGDSK